MGVVMAMLVKVMEIVFEGEEETKEVNRVVVTVARAEEKFFERRCGTQEVDVLMMER